VATVFNSLVTRGESRENARRFVLQSVVAMFAEDIGLLPEDLFAKLLDEARKAENPTAASYDLIGGLFRQMNDPKPARGGKYAGVDYFNGGLFSKVEPIELQPADLGLLFEAAKQKWQYVQPVIFGTLFEGSLGKEERHALGAHFTYEADIQKIVRPAIVRPWEERIAVAEAARALRTLRREIMDANGWSLRELYKSLETPGENRLRTAHETLDAAVRAAYGMKPAEDILAFLLKLNLELAEKETNGQPTTPPGLPAWVPEPDSFVSRDCVRSPDAPDADGSTAKSAADAAHFYGKEEGPPYMVNKT
jgi:hypothetical protein